MDARTDTSPTNTHILAFPFPAKGHINPMLHLCNLLASKGFKVTLVTTSSTFKDVKTIAKSLINIEPIPDGVDLEEPPNWNLKAYFSQFSRSTKENMTKVIEKYKGSSSPLKAVIYDSTMPWILDVAHDFELLGASFFTQSCSVSAVNYHIYRGTIQMPLQEPIAWLPYLPPLENNDLPEFEFFKGHREVMANVSLCQFSNIDKVDYILFNTFRELEAEVAEWMESIKWPILTVGPTAASMVLNKVKRDDSEGRTYLFETNHKVCLTWLDEQETDSVIYVSFGSLVPMSKKQMEEVAQGLRRSNYNFLWVVRAEEESKLPKDFTSETSEKGLIINWCPQLDVLAHRAVACFMTHCGWNSTIEALSSGVPMITVPQAMDQTTHAKFVADVWKTGVRVKVNENGIVTRDEIERCIREVTKTKRGKEVIRRNAAKWKKLAKKAVSKGGSSDENIEKFASSILL